MSDRIRDTAVASAISVALTALVGVAFGSGLRILKAPAEIDALKQDVRAIKAEQLPLKNKVLNVKMDWVVRVLSKRFGEQPPDLSQFEKESSDAGK